MTAIAIDRDAPFATVLGPLMPRLATLHWMLDLQSGPFRITDKPEYEALEMLLDALFIDVPHFAGADGVGHGYTSFTLWRPGTLAVLAPLLVHDEQGFHFGISGDTAAAVSAATALARSPRDERLIEALPGNAELFAHFGSDSWEVHATSALLANELLELPGARRLDRDESIFLGGRP